MTRAIRHPSPWVWVDFENTPHVLCLEPLARELARIGWSVRFTARAQAQTLELAALRELSVMPVGGGNVQGVVRKAVSITARAIQLAGWVWRERTLPRLLISCSRSASLAAKICGIPAIALVDYEHAERRLLHLSCTLIWYPDLLRDVIVPMRSGKRARFFPGLKENLYLDSWPLDREGARTALGLRSADTFVVARPPAETAHYAKSDSLELWLEAVRRLAARPEHRVMIVARTAVQQARVTRAVGEGVRIHVADRAIDGPALVNAADLVVGGGGTMNREAAVLGVPVWSVFGGPVPHIDDVLAGEGRLRWVRTPAELGLALSEPIPARRESRGPVREGVSTILDDLVTRLSGSPKEEEGR